MRLKEIDENRDGNPDLREHYDAEGKLVKSEEDYEGNGRLSITWFYSDAEEAVRAEKDWNSHSVPEIILRPVGFVRTRLKRTEFNGWP